ncbi:hypothetical protein N7467_011855 [Penicillium canescens]|nr:hypothetical protein N7467_011855 [Penicillium canescens]
MRRGGPTYYGLLDSLYFTDMPHWSIPTVPAGWIEVEVECVGLNFRDIMQANNQIPVEGFGVECSGVVIAIGHDMESLQVGDRVCALADCCFSTQVRCPAACAWPIGSSSQMAFEEAASILVAFTTAIYALSEVGRLRPAEKVLIHAAAGGVGQAAVMVAQNIGAEIFATVSSVTKKNLLINAFGIPEDHIFFSRDMSFVDGIRSGTNGRGVDVVLNSLAGEYLLASFECVASYGRFVEIGKKDIVTNSRLEMAHFAHNISFSAVDLSTIGRDRPDTMRLLMEQAFQLLKTGQARPIAPLNVFDVHEIAAAFQLLQSGHSAGKTVIQFKKSSFVKVIPACARDTKALQGDNTYVIIGGTGGLGQSLTRWLVMQGAKRILLVSRSGSEVLGINEMINSMASEGVIVEVLQCDISRRQDVQDVIVPHLRKVPPVKGVIHSAMVLKDAAFENMTWGDFTSVLEPKVAGLYNLNEVIVSLGLPLAFFIGLSSVAGLVGNRGQGAYAAANTFINAFSQFSKANGTPFISIDLAAMQDVGYLANDTMKRDRVSELLGSNTGMREHQLHHLLTATIHPRAGASPNAHIITGLESIVPDSEQKPFWAHDARFSYLLDYASNRQTAIVASGKGDSTTAGERLKLQGTLDDAYETVLDALSHKIATVVVCPGHPVNAETSLSTLNLDSLSAIELRKWVSLEFEAFLELLEILTSPTLSDLANIVLSKSRLLPEECKVDWGLA